MNKPLAIGATLALAIALTGCQQPKPAAPLVVEPPAPIVAPAPMPPVATPPPTETGASLTIAPAVVPTKEIQNADSPTNLEILPAPAATTTDVQTDATLNIAPAPGEVPTPGMPPQPGTPMPPPAMP